jgi:hypothetical protein
MGYHGIDERHAICGGGDIAASRDERVEYNPQQLHGIPPEQVDAVWPLVEPWLIGSAESTRGKYTADDIKSGLLSGHAQLWLWHSPTAIGVLVTTIAVYPQNRCCVVKIGTGENADEWWDSALERLEDFARFAGCTDMEIICRPGWANRFKSKGYDRTHVYMEKRL